MEERIKELMEAQHMNQQVFAEFLGISSATLSSIFSKRTKVTLNTVKAIKDKFPTLNYSWLLDGTGPMFLDGKSDAATSSPSTPSSSANGEAFIDFGDASDPADENPSVPSASSQSSSSSPSSPSRPSSVRGQQTSGMYSSAGSQPGRSNPNIIIPKNINNFRRNVAQILVIYDDQTCETFVPKK